MAFTTVSYAVGAAFLLATLLVLASRARLIPAGVSANKLFPILAGVLVFLAVNYNLGPSFAARWRFVWASAKSIISVRSAPPPATPPPAPRPAVQSVSHARPIKRPAANLKGVVVIRGSAAVSGESAPPVVANPLPLPRPETPEQAAPPPAAVAAPAASAQSSSDAPHDGRLKRAFRHAGNFLHVTHRDQAPEGR